jgi:hypothetical protein
MARNLPSANRCAAALARRRISWVAARDRASSRLPEAFGGFPGTGAQSRRTLIQIFRPALNIASPLSRRMAVLFPRPWEWVRAIRRIYRTYRKAHGFYPSLIFPVRYTEKIQWRKLFDLNPTYPVLCDKLAVRDVVSERVGPEFLVPLLWTGDSSDAIPFDALGPPYIIKSTHATGHTIIVEERNAKNEEAIRQKTRGWLETCHGTALDEIGYFSIPRRLIAEKLLLQEDGSPPMERKLFVFHGVAKVIQTVAMSVTDRTAMVSYHTADWTQLHWKATHPPPSPPDPPRRFREMVRIAERLAAGLDHVRVDMYECGEEIYVGEMTLYSHSGLHSFQPHSADYLLGSYWDLRPRRMRALWMMLTKRREIPCRNMSRLPAV